MTLLPFELQLALSHCNTSRPGATEKMRVANAINCDAGARSCLALAPAQKS